MPESVSELMKTVEMLQLRVAAEQQCVVREQHITARMWMEKAQAEERTDAALEKISELEGQVAAWEAWHQSQRRQQRQRRKEAMLGFDRNPEAMLRAMLSDWGITSVQAMQPAERERLAAGLRGRARRCAARRGRRGRGAAAARRVLCVRKL